LSTWRWRQVNLMPLWCENHIIHKDHTVSVACRIHSHVTCNATRYKVKRLSIYSACGLNYADHSFFHARMDLNWYSWRLFKKWLTHLWVKDKNDLVLVSWPKMINFFLINADLIPSMSQQETMWRSNQSLMMMMMMSTQNSFISASH